MDPLSGGWVCRSAGPGFHLLQGFTEGRWRRAAFALRGHEFRFRNDFGPDTGFHQLQAACMQDLTEIDFFNARGTYCFCCYGRSHQLTLRGRGLLGDCRFHPGCSNLHGLGCGRDMLGHRCHGFVNGYRRRQIEGTLV